MTLRFAAARTAAHSPIARALACRAPSRAANDNDDRDGASADDPVLGAALRHFAQHGLGAAREAQRRAEAASASEDQAAFDWWLGVCRTLDRRLAAQLVRRIGDASKPAPSTRG